jgi:hypothetical protein
MDTSCYQCGKPTDQRCPSCGRFVCMDHFQSVANDDIRVFCKDCLLSGQRVTRFLLWFCLPILLIASVVLVVIALEL